MSEAPVWIGEGESSGSVNYLRQVRYLHNSYFAMRHGRSLANEEERIVSSPEQAVSVYGLTEEGRRQVESAIEAAIRDGSLDSTTVIVTSDFVRARESAEIAREMLGAEGVVLTPKLRERWFGGWDGQGDGNYARVWADDATDGGHRHNGVESTEDVLARTTSLVMELEECYLGRSVLLVSHGDTLQILQTAFWRVPSAQHRRLPHLQTGEIRRLELKAVPPEDASRTHTVKERSQP